MRAERAAVAMPASIVTMNAYQFPDLADISSTGAKLTGPCLPPEGTKGLLRAGTLEVLCQVVWVRGGQCGIRFVEPVSPVILRQVKIAGAVTVEPIEPAASLPIDHPDNDICG